MKTRARKVQFWSKVHKQLVLAFMEATVVVTTVAKPVVIVIASIAVVINTC